MDKREKIVDIMCADCADYGECSTPICKRDQSEKADEIIDLFRPESLSNEEIHEITGAVFDLSHERIARAQREKDIKHYEAEREDIISEC